MALVRGPDPDFHAPSENVEGGRVRDRPHPRPVDDDVTSSPARVTVRRCRRQRCSRRMPMSAWSSETMAPPAAGPSSAMRTPDTRSVAGQGRNVTASTRAGRPDAGQGTLGRRMIRAVDWKRTQAPRRPPQEERDDHQQDATAAIQRRIGSEVMQDVCYRVGPVSAPREETGGMAPRGPQTGHQGTNASSGRSSWHRPTPALAGSVPVAEARFPGTIPVFLGCRPGAVTYWLRGRPPRDRSWIAAGVALLEPHWYHCRCSRLSRSSRKPPRPHRLLAKT